MNRLKRSDQVLPGLNFTIGLSGERRASATGRSMLHGNAVVKAPPDTQSRERGWCLVWEGAVTPTVIARGAMVAAMPRGRER